MDVNNRNSYPSSTFDKDSTSTGENDITRFIYQCSSSDTTIPECARYAETYFPDSPIAPANTYTAMDSRPTQETVTIETKPHWSLQPNNRFSWQTSINREEIKQPILVSNQKPSTNATIHGKICENSNDVYQPELVLAPIYFNRDRAIISPDDIGTIINMIKEIIKRTFKKVESKFKNIYYKINAPS